MEVSRIVAMLSELLHTSTAYLHPVIWFTQGENMTYEALNIGDKVEISKQSVTR